MSDVSLGTRPRYSLVVDEDVKKPTKKKQKTKKNKKKKRTNKQREKAVKVQRQTYRILVSLSSIVLKLTKF